MQTTGTRLRIVRALERGPLYEGALKLVVGEREFYGSLMALQRRGVVERDLPANPQTWKLVNP